MQSSGIEQNFVDVQSLGKIELNASVLLQHLDANRILTADKFLFRVDPDVEVVGEQIVVSAIRPIGAAQKVCLGWRIETSDVLRESRGLIRWRWLRCLGCLGC